MVEGRSSFNFLFRALVSGNDHRSDGRAEATNAGALITRYGLDEGLITVGPLKIDGDEVNGFSEV